MVLFGYIIVKNGVKNHKTNGYIVRDTLLSCVLLLILQVY